MNVYVPDYYPFFHCIASKCRHTCCAGWEIDVDDATAALYLSQPGAFGAELAAALTEDGEGFHFV